MRLALTTPVSSLSTPLATAALPLPSAASALPTTLTTSAALPAIGRPRRRLGLAPLITLAIVAPPSGITPSALTAPAALMTASGPAALSTALAPASAPTAAAVPATRHQTGSESSIRRSRA